VTTNEDEESLFFASYVLKDIPMTRSMNILTSMILIYLLKTIVVHC